MSGPSSAIATIGAGAGPTARGVDAHPIEASAKPIASCRIPTFYGRSSRRIPWVLHSWNGKDFDDLDPAFLHHEMRVLLHRGGQGFLRLGLQDGVAAEIVRARSDLAVLAHLHGFAERRAHVDDGRSGLLAPIHPRIHSRFLLL